MARLLPGSQQHTGLLSGRKAYIARNRLDATAQTTQHCLEQSVSPIPGCSTRAAPGSWSRRGDYKKVGLWIPDPIRSPASECFGSWKKFAVTGLAKTVQKPDCNSPWQEIILPYFALQEALLRRRRLLQVVLAEVCKPDLLGLIIEHGSSGHSLVDCPWLDGRSAKPGLPRPLSRLSMPEYHPISL